VRHGSFNRYDSDEGGLGCDVVQFILSLSDPDIDQMSGRLRALKWANLPDGNWWTIPGAAVLPMILEGSYTSLPDLVDNDKDGKNWDEEGQFNYFVVSAEW
jgi:hypothetical protein